MKFRRVLLLSLLGPWTLIAAAAPEESLVPSQPALQRPLQQLIADLDDEQFKTREQATHALWTLGEAALQELGQAAQSSHPEQAYRARELIRKIELHITPQTDPAVIALVERYRKAGTNEKIGLIEQMRKKRAWHQILKLFASETDAEVQTRVEPAVREIAVIAAREALVAGDSMGARAFLEMAPADPVGLLALAAFHQSQGSLDSELRRAKTLKGHAGSAWQLALYRAKGDLVAAQDAAKNAGEPKLAATMAALLGDPVPWMLLRGSLQSEEAENPIHPPYTGLAIRRWQGKPLRPLDLEPLIRSSTSGELEERSLGVNSLFLLGESALAEKAYAKNSPLEAFAFFESLERHSEALAVIGLDPDRPDYAAWVEQRFALIAKEQLEDDHEESPHLPELLLFAGFFEGRGLQKSLPDVFGKPLAALAEKDPTKFLKLIGLFLSANGVRSEVAGAPTIAAAAASSWAGDQVERWDAVIDAVLGEQDEVRALWNWLLVLEPSSSPRERFAAMLVLCGISKDPHGLRQKWLTLAWAAIEKTPEDQRAPLFDRMLFLVSVESDSATSLKLWDFLPSSRHHEFSWRTHVHDLSAAERWDQAATFFLNQIKGLADRKSGPEPYFHAAAAACLRKAGRPTEAAAQDSLVDQLALGRDSLEIANGYAFGYDYTRAAAWWEKATRLSDPESDEFTIALRLHGEMLITQGKWKEMASISEISAQMAAGIQSRSSSPLLGIRFRIHSDLGRALSTLKLDRAKSIALLDRCRQICPNDGSMADYFFPALRKAGLLSEHHLWFEQAWRGITAAIERFPDAENTYNTAGWMAARAQRFLDQAETFVRMALAKSPDQAAYLDTMAEIQFARGNRQGALDWSAKAVNFMPLDTMIRRQHERFRSAPLPR
jgi:tetratricopeptide (TPR) repeat protein